MTRALRSIACVVALSVGLSACSGGDSPTEGSSPPQTTPSSETTGPSNANGIPTAEELAAALVTSEELNEALPGGCRPQGSPECSGGWGPVGPGLEGLVLGQAPYLCEEASEEARAAADSLDWQATTEQTWAWDLAAEALLAGEPDEIQTTFAALKEGMTACLSGTTEGFSNRPLTSSSPYTKEVYEVDLAGEESYATRDLYDDNSMYTYVLLRHDAVLALIVMATDGGLLTDENVRNTVETMVDKLP